MKAQPLLKRTLSLIAYLVAAIAIAYFFIQKSNFLLTADDEPPLSQNFSYLDGSTEKFSNLSNKGLVINFWATWCPPCQKELPIFSKIHKKYGQQINFLGPAIDSDPEQIDQAIKKFLLAYPMARVDEKVLKAWRVHTLPTTYVLDSQGKIIFSKMGEVSESQLERAVLKALEQNKDEQPAFTEKIKISK